ncbi:MAG: VWD domain-containing protein [Microthrixaceae bacterium]|nr:VWD domain-containing protein [Microthrixaceae bacterium]
MIGRDRGQRLPGGFRTGSGNWRGSIATTFLLLFGACLVVAACVPEPDQPTSTTTSSTSTSSTSTVPPAEPATTYAYTEPSVMFTGAGQAVEIGVGSYVDGEPTGADVPDGVTTEVLGDTTAFQVDDLGGGRFRVTATDEVGGIVVATRVPGQALAATAEVYTVQPQPDVTVVAPSSIAFPLAGAAPGVDFLDQRDSFVTDEAVGPFTWQELKDRAFVPVDTDVDIDDEPEEPNDPGAVRMPYVLRGPAPAVGAKLLSSGSNGIAGEVVAAVERVGADGRTYSLVTVQGLALTDLYARMKWAPDPVDLDATADELATRDNRLVRAGVVPESYEMVTSCPDGSPVEECEDPVTNVVMNVVGPDGTPVQVARHRSRGVGTELTRALVRTQVNPASPVVCKAELKAAIAKLKGPDPRYELHPQFDFSALIDADAAPRAEHVFMLAGYTSELTVSFSGKIQASVAVPAECSKALGLKTIPVPMGPAASVLAFAIKADVLGTFELALEGGPSIDFVVTCVGTNDQRVGFIARSGPQGRLANVVPLRRDVSTKDCTPELDRTLGLNDRLVAAKLEMSAMLGAKVSFGFQVGGSLAGRWAKLLGDPNEGFFDVANVVVGPRLVTARETTARVLQNAEAETRSAIELYAKGELGSEALARMTAGIGLDAEKVKNAIGVTLFEVAEPIVSIYEPINPDPESPMQLWVDGAEDSSPVTLRTGETLRVQATLKGAEPAIHQSINSAKLYVRQNVVDYEELPGDLAANALTFDGTVAITEEICDTIGHDPVNILVVAPSFIDGAAQAVDAYGGKFQAKCLQPDLSLDRESVSFRSDQTGFPTTVNLKATLLRGEEWMVAGKPDWLTLTPGSGTFTAEDESVTPISVTVDCSAQPSRVSAQIVVSALNSETGLTMSDTLDVSADCRDVYLDASPKSFSVGAAGGTVTTHVKTDGPHPIVVDGAGTGAGKLFLAGFQEGDISLTVPAQKPSCGGAAPRTLRYPYTSRPAVAEDLIGRGSFTLVVEQAGLPGDPDRCDTAGSWGDPHLSTFGGDRFGAQTKGEYWYAMPAAGGPDIAVQARQEKFRSGSEATGITAVAARVDGHLFEWYSRSASPGIRLKVDGEVTQMPYGSTIEVSSGVSITAELDFIWLVPVWKVTTPSGSIAVSQFMSYDTMNVTFSLDTGAQVTGLLGSPDGDPTNDLRGRDGTSYQLRDVRLHGADLLNLAGSWRITNLSDSLFSERYDGFDDPMYGFDPADVEAKRAQAQAYLSGIEVICGVASPDDHDYVVEMLATEMAAGTDDAALARATCGYEVTGRVTSALPDGTTMPISGLHMTLTEGRLDTCAAVTGADGSYSCTLYPRHGVDRPTQGTAPVNISIEGAWAAGDPAVITGSASAPSLAPLGGDHFTTTSDFSVDAADLVQLHVAGRLQSDLTGDGLDPIVDPVSATVTLRDTGGALLKRYEQTIVPDTSGDYSFLRYLQGNTASAELRLNIVGFPEDRPTFTFATHPGENEFEANVSQRPPLAAVSGVLVNGAGQPLGPTAIEVTGTTGGTPNNARHQRVVVPDATGAYRVVVPLSSSSTGFVARAMVGVIQADYPSITVGSVQVGLNESTLSTTYDPPVARLSGTLTDGAGQPLGPTEVIFTSYTAAGNLLSSHSAVATPDATGAYTVEHALPLTATKARMSVYVGAFTSDAQVVVIDPVSEGVNSRTLNYVLREAQVDLRGHLTGLDMVTGSIGALPSPQRLRYTPRDESGTQLEEPKTIEVVVDPTDGAYATTFEVPSATASMDVELVVGTYTADRPRTTVNGITAGQTTVADFDANFTPTVLKVHGSIVLGGVPQTAGVRIEVREADGAGGTTSTTRVVSPGAAGTYEADVVLHLASTSATVTVVPVGAESRSETVMVNPVTPGWMDVPVVIDSSDTQLRAGGELVFFGEVQNGPVEVRLRSYDENLAEIGPGGRLVTLVAYGLLGGIFDETIDLDPATRFATLTAEVPVAEAGETVGITSELIDITPGVVSPTTWYTDGAYVSVDAALTMNGDPIGTSAIPVITRAFDLGASSETGGSPRHQSTQTITPDSQGHLQLSTFVPVNPNDSSQPALVEFELPGNFFPIVHQVFLSRGLAVYVESTQLDLYSELRDVIVRMARNDDAQLEFISYRMPSAQADSAIDYLSKEVEASAALPAAWDPNEQAYRFAIPVSLDSTHLRLRIRDQLWPLGTGAPTSDYMIEIPAGTSAVEFTPTEGEDVSWDGWSRTTGGDDPENSCGLLNPRRVPAQVEVLLGWEDPDDPDQMIYVRRFDSVWLVPDLEGEFSFPFRVDTVGYSELVVNLTSEPFGSAAGASGSTTIDLSDHAVGDPIVVELDNMVGCP